MKSTAGQRQYFVDRGRTGGATDTISEAQFEVRSGWYTPGSGDEDRAPVEEQGKKRTREEAAEMVLRTMAADMRRQGWTLSDEQVNDMVARIRHRIVGG